MEIITQNAQDTQKLGEKIAIDLNSKGNNTGAKIITLDGELGSGKTTFIQGMVKALGITHRVVSPTFIIIKRYKLNLEKFDWLYHIDLYRLKNVNIEEFGLNEIFTNPKNFVVIEWADKLANQIPKNAISLKFEIISENQRKITLENFI